MSTATDNIVCFVSGTLIHTVRGEVAVEDLVIGDLVVTASGAPRPIKWLGHRMVSAGSYHDPKTAWPIRFQAGSIAMGMPRRDLLVSPDHCLFFDDVLIPAKHLVNDATIHHEPMPSVDYWHIGLDAHEVLLAEGVPAESFRDRGAEADFFEAGESWGTRASSGTPARLFAPHALSGPRLHAVKAWLIARAGHLGAQRVDDPDLEILADGQKVKPVSVADRRFVYDLPEGARDIVLRSRTSVPAHWIADNEDVRALGVRVSDLQIDGTQVAMTDERLSRGWHPAEPNGEERWTDGGARLPSCRNLSFVADWFLGYPVPGTARAIPTAPREAGALPVLRLVANG